MTETKTSPSWTTMVYQGFKSFISHFLCYCNITFLKIFGLYNRNTAKNGSHSLKKVKDIPGPVPLPVFGTTLTSAAMKESNLLKANEERMTLYGPIVKEEYLWGFPMIHLLDPDHIESAVKVFGTIRPGMDILCSFRKSKPDRYDTVGIANTEGQEWEKLHSVLAPLMFSPKFIKSITPNSNEMAMDFVDLIRKAGPTLPDFTQVCKKYVAETSFYNVYGTRMGFIQDDDKIPQKMIIFLESHEKFWDALHQSTNGFPWKQYLFPNWWMNAVKNEDFLLDLVDELIQKGIKDETTFDGILGDLLASKEVSYKTKRLLALEIIFGAGDTVISTITFTLYWISQDDRVANKLFQELRSLLLTKDSPFGDDFLTNLPYLKACIMETYRVCSIAPNLMRITEQPLDVGGYHIPPYSLVVTQWAYAAMQENAFYKAKEFLPERWIYDGNVPPFQPHRRHLVHPFGYGKRACPGSRIVKQHISILLARIFRNFEVKFEGPLETKYEWLVQPVTPCKVTFRERQE